MTAVVWFWLLVWLFVGYYASGVTARYFVDKYSQALGQRAWSSENNLVHMIFVVWGPMNLIGTILFLLLNARLQYLFSPLWSWPWWTYMRKEG